MLLLFLYFLVGYFLFWASVATILVSYELGGLSLMVWEPLTGYYAGYEVQRKLRDMYKKFRGQ